jgi:hypothetical protein
VAARLMVRFVLAAVVVHFHPVHYLFVSLRRVLHQGLVLVRAELGKLAQESNDVPKGVHRRGSFPMPPCRSF